MIQKQNIGSFFSTFQEWFIIYEYMNILNHVPSLMEIRLWGGAGQIL